MTTRHVASRTGIPTPTATTNPATKTYVDTAVSGVSGGGGATPSYATMVGDGTSGPFVVTHSLGTRHVSVLVYRATAPYEEVIVRVEHTTTNVVTLVPDEVWSANQFYAIVKFVAQSDATAPTAPTVAVSAHTSTTVDLTWSGATDNVGVVGYNTYLNGVKANSTLIAGTTCEFQNLTAATTYTFNVTAVDAAGNESALSNTVTQLTDGVSDTTPPVAGVLTFSSVTAASITYTFTAGTDNVGVTQIDAYDADGVTLLAAAVSSPYTRSGLTASTSYGTLLRYRDAAGNHSDSNTVTQTTSTASTAAFSTASAGARGLPGTTPAVLSDSVVVGAGTSRYALCWVAVSHSTSNNPAVYDTATCVSDQDGAWTLITAQADGPFSGQKQGAIILFAKANPAVGTHNLTVTIAKAGFSFASIQVQTDIYTGIASLGTPVLVDQPTSGVLNVSITPAAGNLAACGSAMTSAPAGQNFNVRYHAGGSVTGTGDYMLVQDIAGDGTAKVFTTTSAQESGAVAVELVRAP